jgi:hypothetical protein
MIGDKLIVYDGTTAIEFEDVVCINCGSVMDKLIESQLFKFDWSSILEHKGTYHLNCGGELLWKQPLPKCDTQGNVIPTRLP